MSEVIKLLMSTKRPSRIGWSFHQERFLNYSLALHQLKLGVSAKKKKNRTDLIFFRSSEFGLIPDSVGFYKNRDLLVKLLFLNQFSCVW